MIRILISFILLFFLTNCSNETKYSGKIINQETFENINFKNKEILISKLGYPRYIDPISKKYFYFSKKEEKSSIFKKDVNYSYVFVFEFNNQENIISSNVYDLKSKENIKLIEEETQNDIIKRGLLEKIFGGVGPQKELPTTP